MAKQYRSRLDNELQTKVDTIRHNEYYDMQKVFDELYDKSGKGESFDSLMTIILSSENILLAFRNIKSNHGSITPGTDKISITDLKALSSEEIVSNVRKHLPVTCTYADCGPAPVLKISKKGPAALRLRGLLHAKKQCARHCFLQSRCSMSRFMCCLDMLAK